MAASTGVLYLDKGWQTIINGLIEEAEKVKVKIVTGKSVINVQGIREESENQNKSYCYKTRLKISLSLAI